jgi:hypothetical protein
MNFKCITCSACLSLVVLCGGIAPVQADFITFGNGAGSKWGDRQFGTSSGVITWSFMSEGTTLSAAHPLIGEISGGTGAGSSLNGLRSAFDGVYGASSFDSAIQNAFNTWSAASPGRIEFQHVADNGAVAGDPSLPASSAIDIRIGGFHSLAGSGFSFVGAVGYGPPGDAINFPDPVAGDILINLDSLFIRAAGSEDDVFYHGGTYSNDLEGLVLHELGHAAIGLGHSTDGPNAQGIGDVMYVDDFPNCCNFINRQLSAQDIAGARSVYGAVPEPSALWALLIAVISLRWHRRTLGRSGVVT